MTDQSAGSLRELASLFTRLGFTAFGGPAAHIAMLHDEVVTRRGWTTEQHFLDLIGATNLIPGPNSTEMVMHVGKERAGNLSGGQKKLLELGRTMMVDAKVVLLDEVGAGVNRTLLKTIASSIQRLNQERGYTFCMIEHDMDFIELLCDPVIVMAEGKLLTQGSVTEVKNNEEVIEAYLGTGRKHERVNPSSASAQSPGGSEA